MSITRIATAAVIVALVATGCSGASAEDTTTTAPPESGTPSPTQTSEVPLRVTPRSYEDYRNQPTACGANQPPPLVEMTFDAPEQVDIGAEPVTATIATSCGGIVVELDATGSPETVNSFVFLAEQGYFDGSASHRIFPGFIIQAGDPTATGRGGPGYVIADEFRDDGFLYERGVVAMANAGPATTGSQFFFVLADAPLPPQFNVLGRVVQGLDVMDAIAGVELTLGLGGDSVPTTPLESVYIESVEIQR